MSSEKPVAYQIPVDQIDFSPNISDQAENFFQTDADIARMQARQGMVNYDKGQAIKVSSKVLDMCPGRKIRSNAAQAAPAAQDQGEDLDEREFAGSESGEATSAPTIAISAAATATAANRSAGTGRTIVVDDKAVLGATMFLAESGHVARKINLETGKTMRLFHGHTGPVTRVAVYYTQSGEERLVTGSWDKTIKIWDTHTKECLATLKGHTDFVKAIVVRALIVKKTDDSGKEIQVRQHELFSASYDGTILHWDLETFTPYQGGKGGPWKGHVRGINDLCLTVEEDSERPDDAEGDDHGKEYLYSAGSDGTIRKWDITKGQGRGGHCVHVFNHHATTVYRVIVEAVEIWSASADKTAQRLDLETKKVDTTLMHPDFVKSIALAGPYIVTGGRQETIRVWSVATGKLIKEITGHFDEVSSMVAIGTTLFTGSLDNTVRRWSLKEQDLVTPPPQDIVEALADKSAVNTPTNSKGPEAPLVNKASAPKEKPSLMTEEEERELAELMGSDFEDD
ncbi:hypothetical protein EMPS_01943 [Entomortierella parvispora]|uniref:WD40 repeat-like protein n=1 Tax=Entomortierella parvispora TaxID=205924 RepID=A0A9P3LT09_9FUNG|nr:hypothetical protein EMPS_01943 [Entomortierella parvispora]